MPAPFYTTNDSEISRLEGLYIKELSPPAAISGVFLGTTGVVGDAVRGPVDVPIAITSQGQFASIFGGRDQGAGGPIASSLWKALMNKPFGKLIVVRAAAAAATSAQATIYGKTFGTGTVQCAAKANYADGDTVTINDGQNAAVVFEFRLTGTAPTTGHVKVDLSTAVSAADVSAVLYNAILTCVAPRAATPLAVQVILGASGLVSLTTETPGTAGNVGITKSSTASGFSVTGFAGGANNVAIATIAATSPGIWGNNVAFQAQNATDGEGIHWNLVATYLGKSYTYKNLDMSEAGVDNSLATVGDSYANVIELTKIASGVPTLMVAAQSLTGGAEGTIADADFTAANRGINVLAATKGIGCIFIAERSSAALKQYVETIAPGATDRLFLVGADSETVTPATAATDSTSGSFSSIDRTVYCFNHPYTLDPATATEVLTRPESWLASILSQIDVDIHPGEEDTKAFTSGITRLYYPALQREDYITLKNAGVCALEEDEGFAFVSGVTTCLTPGKEQITRRRMADFLQGSIAGFLKHIVKKKDTETRKTGSASIIESFLDKLQAQERVVKASKVDPDILNNDDDEGNGIVRILVKVKLISHILELVLETEIGTSVNVTDAA